MRSIDHFVAGGALAAGTRQGDVFDPNNGGVQARVGLGGSAELDKAMADRDEELLRTTIEQHIDRLRDLLRSS